MPRVFRTGPFLGHDDGGHFSGQSKLLLAPEGGAVDRYELDSKHLPITFDDELADLRGGCLTPQFLNGEAHQVQSIHFQVVSGSADSALKLF
jgi:hypothetical protein